LETLNIERADYEQLRLEFDGTPNDISAAAT
jgi:hypothetical protein